MSPQPFVHNRERDFKMRMSNDEYIRTQVRLVGIGNMLKELNVDAFIASAREAESVGAVLDPTLYRRGAESLIAIRRYAEAAAELKKAFAEVQRVVIERVEREGFPDVPCGGLKKSCIHN